MFEFIFGFLYTTGNRNVIIEVEVKPYKIANQHRILPVIKFKFLKSNGEAI